MVKAEKFTITIHSNITFSNQKNKRGSKMKIIFGRRGSQAQQHEDQTR